MKSSNFPGLNKAVKAFDKAVKSFNAQSSSMDASMKLSYDELIASVGKDSKIPGSIFGEVLLPGGGISDIREVDLNTIIGSVGSGNYARSVPTSDTVPDVTSKSWEGSILKRLFENESVLVNPRNPAGWMRGKTPAFPENRYCTREQLHALLIPSSRPRLKHEYFVDGELVLSYKNILHGYQRFMRPFITSRGRRLPQFVPIVGMYRKDMNELLEYLIQVFPPYIESELMGRFTKPVPYRIVPFADRIKVRRRLSKETVVEIKPVQLRKMTVESEYENTTLTYNRDDSGASSVWTVVVEPNMTTGRRSRDERRHVFKLPEHALLAFARLGNDLAMGRNLSTNLDYEIL